MRLKGAEGENQVKSLPLCIHYFSSQKYNEQKQNQKTKKKKQSFEKKSETHDFFGQHQGSASNSRFGFRTLFAHFPCFRRLLGHFFAHPVGSFFLCLLFLRPHREAKTTPFLSMNSMFRPFLCAIILTCFFASFRVFFDCFACSFALFFVASRTIFFSFFAPKCEFRVIFLTTFFKTFSHFMRIFVELGCLFVARVGHLFPQCFDFWNCLWIAFGGYPDRPKCEFR